MKIELWILHEKRQKFRRVGHMFMYIVFSNLCKFNTSMSALLK